MYKEGQNRPGSQPFWRIPTRGDVVRPTPDVLAQGDVNLRAMQDSIRAITSPYYEAIHRAAFDMHEESRRKSLLSLPCNRTVTIAGIPNNPSTYEVQFKQVADEIHLEALQGHLRGEPSESTDAELRMDLQDAAINSISLTSERHLMGSSVLDRRAFLHFLKGKGALGRFAIEFLAPQANEIRAYGAQLVFTLADIPTIRVQVDGLGTFELPTAKSIFQYDPISNRFVRTLDPKTRDIYRSFDLSLREEVAQEEYFAILKGALGLIPIEEDK